MIMFFVIPVSLSVQDVEVEKQSHFAIVSMKTAASTTVSSLSSFFTS